MTQNDPGPPTWLFALAQRSGLDRHTFMQLLGTGRRSGGPDGM